MELPDRLAHVDRLFNLRRVDIAREVEIEFVPLDLVERDDARVSGQVLVRPESVRDLPNVLVAQPILVRALFIPARRIDEQHSLSASRRLGTVQDEDGSRDSRSVEEVNW